MPSAKRRHQRESASGEPKRPEDPPEPKRQQRETANTDPSITQGRPATDKPSNVASGSTHSQVVHPSAASSSLPSGPLLRVIHEMSSDMNKAVRGPPAGVEEIPPHVRGRHVPLASGRQSDSNLKESTVSGTEVPTTTLPASAAAAGVSYPTPRSSVSATDVGIVGDAARTNWGPSSSSISSFPPAASPTGTDLWGGLSEAEVRRQISMLEALERRRMQSKSPSPLSLPSTSPLSTPPLSPPVAASRPDRLEALPLPPASLQGGRSTSNMIRQPSLHNNFPSSYLLDRPRGGPGSTSPQYGDHDYIPSADSLPPRLNLENAMRPSLRTSNITLYTDRIRQLQPRSCREAMSVHSSNAVDTLETEVDRLYTLMNGNPNRTSDNLPRDLEIAHATGATLIQQEFSPTPPRSISDNAIGSTQRLAPPSVSERPKSEPKVVPQISNKGKQPQDYSSLPLSELQSRVSQLREAVSNRPSSIPHDSTFRFSSSKGYYEAIVPMAYFMNNPNTQAVSTTDPFFRTFPSDPNEIPILRDTSYVNRPTTPEIHLDETPEQKREHAKQKKKAQKKQDWKARKETPLDRSWHLQYGGRAVSTVTRGNAVSAFPSRGITEADAEDQQFRAYLLARARKEYQNRKRAQGHPGLEDAAVVEPTVSRLSDPATDKGFSLRSRRTVRPEEAQPLEVGREPGAVPGSSSKAGPSSEVEPSSSKTPEEDAGDSSLGKKKESRRRK